MAKKIHVGLLFGGLSTEHEVSLSSARNVYKALDKSRYDVSLIRIDKQGYWHRDATPDRLLGTADVAGQLAAETTETVFPTPAPEIGQLLPVQRSDGQVAQFSQDMEHQQIDVIFPVLHGINGEDGTIQGLLKLVNIPFVGASVLGSAVGMDKDVMKRLLRDAGLPVPKFVVVSRPRRDTLVFSEIVDELGLPFFVKPANAGSSVGISRVASEDDFQPALDDAFGHDNKILLEEAIVGREIECAVIGNEEPMASITGEIATEDTFYSYDAKYLNETGTTLTIPADIPEATSDAVRDLAIDVYQVLCCEGMARVDFFLRENGEVLINEINTIPGFTERSMFPVLWEHTGLSQPELVDRLVQLAIERHERDKNLKTSR